MTWMLTANGACLDLQFIADDAIDINDIAHHLAQINRFTGACMRPYSVAEHSLLVVQIMERELAITSPLMLLAGLMHDAHEAYTTDLSSPMKQVVGAAWRTVEARVEHAVAKRFCLLSARVLARTAVHKADLLALSTERAALMPPAGPDWAVTAAYPPLTWPQLEAREHFTWADWRQAFLDRFAELQAELTCKTAASPF